MPQMGDYSLESAGVGVQVRHRLGDLLANGRSAYETIEGIVLSRSTSSFYSHVYVSSCRMEAHLATSESLPKLSHSVEQFHIILLWSIIGRSLHIRGITFQWLDDLVIRAIESERLRGRHRLADSTHRRQSPVDEVGTDVLCSAQRW